MFYEISYGLEINIVQVSQVNYINDWHRKITILLVMYAQGRKYEQVCCLLVTTLECVTLIPFGAMRELMGKGAKQ